MLAFVMPVIAELVIANNDKEGIPIRALFKNSIILLIGAIGMVLGGMTSIMEMIRA